MNITHASIIPLIGGETIGQMQAFGSKPNYLLSYSPFSNNDSHIVNYLKDVPYILLDKGGVHPYYVDVVNAVCPCAGLSSLSPKSNSDSTVNDWMIMSAKYVLEQMKPKVFWGENAPRFAGEMGKPIVDKLMKIAKENNYSMSIYRTRSRLHGLAQVRERSFYFFWKEMNAPVFSYFDRDPVSIEDTIRAVNKTATLNLVTNSKIPSKHDPYYRYVLEVIEGGITHKQFVDKITHSWDAMHYIEEHEHSYRDVKIWMDKNGFNKQSKRLNEMQDKLDSGGNIMRRASYIGKGKIGAFVGHLPMSLTHPDEDRYITYREALSIMGMPEDFELLNHKKNLNHVCQNVPVTTAKDMALEIKAVLEGKRDFVNADLIYQFNTNKTLMINGHLTKSSKTFPV